MKVERWTGRVLEGPLEDVYVYPAPVRLWHWVTMFCIVTLAVTGYFIGAPPPAIGGEAVNSFLFGWIRTIHFSAAMILIVFFLVRIYWAIVGPSWSRQIFRPPLWSGAFWRGIVSDLREYSFVGQPDGREVRWVGHNPLALMAMFFMFVLGLVFIIATGLGLYAQGYGWGSGWMNAFGWVTVLFGTPQAVRTAHHLAMWYMLLFVLVHIYMASRQDILGRGTIISTMINGIRMWKGEPRG